MSQTKWNVKFVVYRQKDGKAPSYQDYTLEVDPEEYVLDGVERIWAYKTARCVFNTPAIIQFVVRVECV